MTLEISGSKYIGIRGWAHGDITTELKRALLFFDQVIVGHVHEPGYCRQFEELNASLATLDESGIIVRGPRADFDVKSYLLLHEVEDDVRRMSSSATWRLPSGRPTIFDTGGPTIQRRPRVELAESYARELAMHLEHPAETRVPLLTNLSNIPFVGTTELPLLRVVFGRLPLPSKTTPWEAILEWRDDEEAKRKFIRLRRWIHDVNPNDPAHVIADRLEAAISDYCEYMRAQHMKFTTGKWEAVVLAILEVLEKLPQIKLSPLLDAAFSARRNRVHLAEAEQKAPSRDVAYILATQQRFS